VPDHPWATPSLLYAKARLRGDDSLVSRAQLIDYARRNPENEQAQRLARWVQPWTHHLPPPEDASTNILRQMVEQKVELAKMSIRLSALEAPSCYLAFRLEAQRQGKETLDLTVTIAEIQKPDPRESRAEKQFELWSYRSLLGLKSDATVQVPAPDPRIRAGIERIAREPYLLARWCEVGRAYAAEIGAGTLKDVLATMVHPSLPPERMPSEIWLQRLQFAAGCTVAGMDEGWNGTLRRRALLSLLRGPIDWISGAAAVVLSEIHLSCAEARGEITRELTEQIHRLPTESYCCLRKPLAAACLRLPDFPPDWIAAFHAWLAD